MQNASSRGGRRGRPRRPTPPRLGAGAPTGARRPWRPRTRRGAREALGAERFEVMRATARAGRLGRGPDGVVPWAPWQLDGLPDALRHVVARAPRRGVRVIRGVAYGPPGPHGPYRWNPLPLY